MVSTRPRIGLALGSGSARGWAHIGVIRALDERGIKPDVLAGASVGALVAAAYASGQLDVLEAWVRRLTKLDVWRLLDTTFRGGGMMRGNRLMRAIGEHIEDLPIEALPIPFGAVAADLNSGQEVWLREGPMLSAVRASSGFPGMFTPVWHQARWLIDGGVVNPVPVSLCRALGADFVIAVNLNTHYGTYPKRFPDAMDKGSLTDLESDEEKGSWTSLERWSRLVDGLIEDAKTNRETEPGMFDVMTTSINLMQDLITRSRMAGDPPNLQISPFLGDFKMMDFHRADEAIVVGRRSVERVASDIANLSRACAGR
jgi:NTE family protein